MKQLWTTQIKTCFCWTKLFMNISFIKATWTRYWLQLAKQPIPAAEFKNKTLIGSEEQR